MIWRRSRIEALDSGRYRLRLPPEERELLKGLPEQLRGLLATDDPSLVRLFPPAYDEPEADIAFDELVGGEIMAGRLEALRILEETADATLLDAKQLDAWLRALNALRLVLGTQLRVSEEIGLQPLSRSDPDAQLIALYQYLSWLQEQAVEAAGKHL
jgi:hypothetical protein